MRKKLTARMFEPFQLNLFHESLTSGETVVDGGASIGLYTLLASHVVGPSGRVVALEPDPRAYAQLRANVVANGCTNVVTLRFAAASRHESRTLYLGDQSTVTGLHHGGRPNRTIAEEQIHCLPVDSLVANTRVNVVKIDVEGAELQVLDGMTLTFSRRQSCLKLFVEVHPEPLSAQGRLPSEVLDLLSSVFPYVRVVDEHSKSLRRATQELLAQRCTIYCSHFPRK